MLIAVAIDKIKSINGFVNYPALFPIIYINKVTVRLYVCMRVINNSMKLPIITIRYSICEEEH